MSLTAKYDTAESAMATSLKRIAKAGGWIARLVIKQSKVLVSLALSAAILIYLFLNYDLASIAGSSAGFSLANMLVVLSLLVFTVVFSCLRFSLVLSDFGASVSVPYSFKAALYSTISGLFFFQFVGQTVTRGVLMERLGIPASSVVVMALYERFVVFAALLLAALAGAFVLFGGISVSYSGGGAYFVRLLTSLFLTSSLIILVLYRKPVLSFVRSVEPVAVFLKYARLTAMTAVTNGVMIICYVLIAKSIIPDVGLLELAAASAIVSFAAALPISFSGWGIRELSAVYVFGTLGVAAEQALAVSIAIGVLSMLALIITMVSANLLNRDQPLKQAQMLSESRIQFLHKIGDALIIVVPVCISVLVLYQVRVPLGESEINVNLADPLVIIGAFMFVYSVYVSKRLTVDWYVPHLPFLVLCCTGMVLLGYVNGYLSFGSNSWALTNRVFGWFVLLGYALSGALMAAHCVRQSGAVRGTDKSLITYARLIVVASASIALFDLSARFARNIGFELDYELFPPAIPGFSNNPNAFVFAICIALALSFAAFGRDGLKGSREQWIWCLATAVLVAAVPFTASRTGMVIVAALILSSVFLRFVQLRWVGSVVVTGAGLYLFFAFGPEIFFGLSQFLIAFSSQALNVEIAHLERVPTVPYINAVSSNEERLQSLLLGIDLWRQNLLFGTGLGASANEGVLNSAGKPLLIHNGYLWILAELGLFGALAFAAMFGSIVLKLVSDMRTGRFDSKVIALCLLLLVFALANLPHEMMYQRIFWFILGALLVVAPVRGNEEARR